ncbi:MAG: hypothetical protein MHMPM18_001457 [Marteilia pararefringens]
MNSAVAVAGPKQAEKGLKYVSDSSGNQKQATRECRLHHCSRVTGRIRRSELAGYRPIKPAASRILQYKWDMRDRRMHEERLKNVKTVVDQSSPRKIQHLSVSAKRQTQAEMERKMNQEREDSILAQKIQRIKCREPAHTQSVRSNGRSSSSICCTSGERQKKVFTMRKNEEGRVNRENLLLLKRLDRMKPTISRQQHLQDFQVHEKRLRSISKF